MSLRGKLARLKAPSVSQREALLDDLRARMRRVLERTSVPRPQPTASAEDTEHRLPFFAEETDLGTMHRRVLRLSAAHRTGRAPARAAKDADRTLLSLLALDPSLANADVSRALYLDTETTGLAGGTGTVAFLVGLAAFDEHGLFVEQLLVRNLGEEAPMLAHVRRRIDDASMLITFNGKTFDMPLLRTRFAMARLEAPPDRPHLDLLHVARRVHRTKHKLTMLEERVLGFVREGDVPSGEVSARYLHFLRTGLESSLLGVVEHNVQDVISMAALVGLYGEPLETTTLAPADLVGIATTLKRAGAHDRAFEAATLAQDRGAGPEALRARASIARARGDRDRALQDLEALLAEVDCPNARLDLAKLYEHHVKDAARALDLVGLGIAEDDARAEKRRARLARKVERQRQTRLFVSKA
jgi:uncharacterized protein YprB with RNaseH-like and TPR domain